MDRTTYVETFDNGPRGWTAWGTGNMVPKIQDGAIISRSPWRVDPNHCSPGGGYLHLLTYIITNPLLFSEEMAAKVGPNRFIEEGKDRNLTNARITVRMRGEVDAKGAKLVLLAQADVPGTRTNWVMTGQTFNITPEWSDQTITLVPDPSQWLCLGSRHDLTHVYGYGDIVEVLKNVDVDLILVFHPLKIVSLKEGVDVDYMRTHRDYEPDYRYLPSGYVMFDTITIEYDIEYPPEAPGS
ncbi:MAG: hypothetical protein EXR62_08880 [Chloroflexi bacterium]|nr:hypothetical protein [Chloroflexota bacterium]